MAFGQSSAYQLPPRGSEAHLEEVGQHVWYVAIWGWGAHVPLPQPLSDPACLSPEPTSGGVQPGVGVGQTLTMSSNPEVESCHPHFTARPSEAM